MINKIILIALFALFSGILIYGGVNRTAAKTGEETHALLQNGNGQGAQADNGDRLYRNRSESSGAAEAAPPSGRGGQGQQRYLAETESHAYVTIEGMVTQAPAAGIDMILETDEGAVQIGTGPGYLDEVGYTIQNGEQLLVTGFWEDGEFKASEITRSADGASIVLRDEFGRPMWSGAVRNGGNGRGAGRATS
jgi:hypothetical protein